MRRQRVLITVICLIALPCVNSCGGGGGDDCGTNDETTYHTYICDHEESPSVENNFCMRDDVLVRIEANEEGETLTLEPSGCPDHVNMDGGGNDSQSCCGGCSCGCGICDGCSCGGCSCGGCSCGSGCLCGSTSICDSTTCTSGCSMCSCGMTCQSQTTCGTYCQGGSCCATCGNSCSTTCTSGCSMCSCGMTCQSQTTCGNYCQGGSCCAICGNSCNGNSCCETCGANCSPCCSCSCEGTCCSPFHGVDGGCGCGCGCGSCCVSGCCGSYCVGDLRTYQASHQTYAIEIPRSPTMLSSPISTDTEPWYDIEFGDPVAVLVNGVLVFADHTTMTNGSRVSHPFVRAADSCNGHSDKAHRYHYHALPRCVLEELGIPKPNNLSYWQSWDTLDVDTQINMWPSTATASPLIGYALDGFPIYGPYNSTGHLQIGNSSTERGNLDDCNFDESSSRYHMTPNPPYVVGCFVAAKGRYSGEATGKPCPRRGLNNTYTDSIENLWWKETCEIWNLLFWKLNVEDATIVGIVFGSLYVIFFALITQQLVRNDLYLVKLCFDWACYVFRALRRWLYRRFCRTNETNEKGEDETNVNPMTLIEDIKVATYAIVYAFVIPRLLYFLMDPFFSQKKLPEFLVGIFYGSAYPSIDAVIALIVFCLVLMLVGVRSFDGHVVTVLRRFENAADGSSGDEASDEFVDVTRVLLNERHSMVASKKSASGVSADTLDKTSQRLRTLSYGLSIATATEYAVQWTADIIRSFDVESPILLICRIYFVCWGIFLVSSCLYIILLIRRQIASANEHLDKMKNDMDISALTLIVEVASRRVASMLPMVLLGAIAVVLWGLDILVSNVATYGAYLVTVCVMFSIDTLLVFVMSYRILFVSFEFSAVSNGSTFTSRARKIAPA